MKNNGTIQRDSRFWLSIFSAPIGINNFSMENTTAHKKQIQADQIVKLFKLLKQENSYINNIIAFTLMLFNFNYYVEVSIPSRCLTSFFKLSVYTRHQTVEDSFNSPALCRRKETQKRRFLLDTSTNQILLINLHHFSNTV